VKFIGYTPKGVKFGAVLAAVIGALIIAACGSSSNSASSTSSAASGNTASAASGNTGASSGTSSTGGGTSSSGSASVSSCGTKPGAAASGTPIRVGAIDTKQAGTDFSDIENMEGAYFACVNANGGVNGHPVMLYKETENSQPSAVSADAKKLVQSDHVVAISGNSSLVECSIDYKYWQSLGYKVIGAGIAPECYGTPNYADANMGARFSSDGAAQYVESIPGVNKIVFDQSNVPGTSYNAGGIPYIAKLKHLPSELLTENVPINNADAVALKEVDAAGPDGAIVLNFTPPEALVILQAATKLGLEDRVKAWSCSTPCNTDFLAKALGPKWVGKFFVNAELNPPDDPSPNSPQIALYKAIYDKYGKGTVSGGIGAFSEMGFTDGEILVHALQSVKGAYTVKSVNKAIENVKNFNTGMLCEPWTYGPYKLHIANHTDYTVTPNAQGVMGIKQGCTKISGADPLMEQYYKAIGQS